MEWFHKCSLEWLKTRQRYLTASDIKHLLPVTRTGRPRKVTDEDYIRVLADKMVTLTEDDCISRGAAARGHLLEPYAIDSLNNASFNGLTFYHWDDIVYHVGQRMLAFSPDAMDIPPNITPKPKVIAEVKSYSAERHLIVAHTKKGLIEERWQIATAMAVEPKIEVGLLTLFNPSLCDGRLIVISYDRSDLDEEIGIVNEIEHKWEKFLTGNIMFSSLLATGVRDWVIDGPLIKDGTKMIGNIWSENGIIADIQQAQRLDP